MLSIIRLTCISNQVYVNKNWENSGARSQRNGGWSNTAAREKKNTNTVSSIPGTLIRVFPWHRPELRRFRLETSSLLFLSSLTKEERTATSFCPWERLLPISECNCFYIATATASPSDCFCNSHLYISDPRLVTIKRPVSFSAQSVTLHLYQRLLWLFIIVCSLTMIGIPYLPDEWPLIPKILFTFFPLVVPLKVSLLDYTVGCHETSVDSVPDKIIYSPCHYVGVLSQSSSDPLCHKQNSLKRQFYASFFSPINNALINLK